MTYIDGVEASRTLTESEVLTEKQDQIISIGMNISSGIPSGLRYKTMYSGVRAVAYHFPEIPMDLTDLHAPTEHVLLTRT